MGIKVRNRFQAVHFPPLLICMKIRGTAEGAELHRTRHYANRQQLLLQRDFFQPEQQHLYITLVTQRHAGPYSGYFNLQVNNYVTVTITKNLCQSLQ